LACCSHEVAAEIAFFSRIRCEPNVPALRKGKDRSAIRDNHL
jgi:hypothetical protein